MTADIFQHGFLLKKGKFTTIDFPGALDSADRDINTRGDITGEFENDGVTSHGFLFSEGKFTTVDFPGAADTYFLTINDSEEIAGSYDTSWHRCHRTRFHLQAREVHHD